LIQLQSKISQLTDATQRMSTGNDNAIKDDALLAPAPVYKQ
jgi:hypothetical protein